MPSGFGTLHLHEDAVQGVLKVEYRAHGSVGYALAQEMFVSSKVPLQHLAYDVAKQMTKYIAKDIEEQLLAASLVKFKELIQNDTVYHASPANWATASPTEIMDEIQKWSKKYQAQSASPTFQQETAIGGGVLTKLSKLIPGFNTMRATCPLGDACNHPAYKGPSTLSLSKVIIHLNDREMWTREQIADWLETLDYDLTFQTPESEETSFTDEELDKFMEEVNNVDSND